MFKHLENVKDSIGKGAWSESGQQLIYGYIWGIF